MRAEGVVMSGPGEAVIQGDGKPLAAPMAVPGLCVRGLLAGLSLLLVLLLLQRRCCLTQQLNTGLVTYNTKL